MVALVERAIGGEAYLLACKGFAHGAGDVTPPRLPLGGSFLPSPTALARGLCVTGDGGPPRDAETSCPFLHPPVLLMLFPDVRRRRKGREVCRGQTTRARGPRS